jgi:hypothetical protein
MENSQLLERIADLERELISTKLQLACAMSSMDSLEHQLAITTSALLKAKTSDNSNTDAPPPPLAATKVVPTANPFSSSETGGDDMDSSRRPRKAMRMLNPGSCASALNLFSEIKDPPRRLSTADGDSRDGGHALRLSRGTAGRPNENSRASGLNLFENLLDKELPSLLTPSMLSLSSSAHIKKRSSHDIALLLGNRRPLSSSSLNGRRTVGSRTNVRGGSRTNVRLGHSYQENSKMNAEWGEFK